MMFAAFVGQNTCGHVQGAVSTFVGTTRDTFEGKKVVRLEYEAYEEMAIEELKRMCTKVRPRSSTSM